MMIFEYKCLDKIVLGKTDHPADEGKEQDKFDEQNREAIMLIKLSITDDQLPQVSSGKIAAEIWSHLKGLHETSLKSRAFFLKNMPSTIMMNERVSLQDHLNKIKDIRDQLEAIRRKKGRRHGGDRPKKSFVFL